MVLPAGGYSLGGKLLSFAKTYMKVNRVPLLLQHMKKIFCGRQHPEALFAELMKEAWQI